MQTIKTLARKALHLAIAIVAGIATVIGAVILFTVGLIAFIYNKMENKA